MTIAAPEELVNDCETSLYLARELESTGREDEAVWPTFAIPHGAQEDWQAGLNMVQDVVDRLRDRGVDVLVTNRPTPNGTVLMLTLDE